MGCGGSTPAAAGTARTSKVPSKKATSATPSSQPQGSETNEKRRESTEIIQSIAPNSDIGKKLKNVPLFGFLTTHERAKLGGALEEVQIQAGGTIYKAGDSADWFYVIQQGEVTQYHNGTDPVCTLQARDYFGEQEILGNEKRVNTMKAEAEGATLYKLHVTKFRALFREDRIKIHFLNRTRLAVTGGANRAAQNEQPIPKATFTPDEKELALEAVNKSLLFQNFDDDHKVSVVDIMYTREVKPGDVLINEGEDGNEFYVIQEGHVDVFQKDEDGNNKKVDEKAKGESFGELALMYDAPRNATCIATIPTVVRVLERRYFNRIVREVGEARFQQYADWLAQVELLAPLAQSERLKLAAALQVVFAEAGLVLCREGDPGSEMYLVVTGEVVFSSKDENGVDQPIEGPKGKCGTGGFFGERALLNNEPRKATVTLTTNCRFLKISREVFESILGPLTNVFKDNEKEYQKQSSENKWQKADIKFKDLVVKGTLGKGAYGFVQLVADKKSKKSYALKAVSKSRIVQTNQQSHIFSEKEVMARLNHPFIVKLHSTFRDKDMLYFLMEPSLGGELFRILRRVKAFPPEQAKFYGGSVVLAFEYLHSKNLVYRDLKPENLLLDAEGYIKVTDFGFCKEVVHKTWTMCGTPEYMAPEIIQSRGHGKGVDWWCVGILLYEMLASQTPFVGKGDMMDMYRRIVRCKMSFPGHFSPEATDLISRLLRIDPIKRLGCDRFGSEGIKQHPWFANFDWGALLWRKLEAPMKIPKESVSELSNFSSKMKPNPVDPYEDDGTNWDADF